MNKTTEHAKQLMDDLNIELNRKIDNDDPAYKHVKRVLDEVSSALNKKIDNGEVVSTSEFYQLFESAMGMQEE